MPSTTSEPGEPRVGRPRDPAVDEVVLAAAESLVTESGYSALTITAVAQRAGTNKPAVYRRWASRQHLAIDLLGRLLLPDAPADTGSIETDLLTNLRWLVDHVRTPAVANLLPALLVDVRDTPELADQLRTQVTIQRREANKDALERGVARGEIVPPSDIGLDYDLVIDLLASPIFSRLLHGQGPIDHQLASHTVTAVLRLLRPGNWPDATAT